MKLTETEMKIRRALGKRLVMIRAGLTQEAYAVQLGIHVNTLARYERGERLPGAEFLRRLSDNGVNLHWLLTGNGHHQLGAQEVSDPATVYEVLSFESIKSSCGIEKPVPMKRRLKRSDEAVGNKALSNELAPNLNSLFFDENWLERCLGVSGSDICMVAMQGDSMEPTIQSGAQVLIDQRQVRSRKDGFFLLRWGSDLLLRRLLFYPAGYCQVMCANPAYTSFVIRESDESKSAKGEYQFEYLSENTRDPYIGMKPTVPKRQRILGLDLDSVVPRKVSVLGRVIWAGQSF